MAQDLPGEEGFLCIEDQQVLLQLRVRTKVRRPSKKVLSTLPHLAYIKEVVFGDILGIKGQRRIYKEGYCELARVLDCIDNGMVVDRTVFGGEITVAEIGPTVYDEILDDLVGSRVYVRVEPVELVISFESYHTSQTGGRALKILHGICSEVDVIVPFQWIIAATTTPLLQSRGYLWQHYYKGGT